MKDNRKLPDGWKWAKLKDLGDVVTGNTPPRIEDRYYGGKIPWIKPEDLDKDEYVAKSAEYLTEEGGKKARLLPKGAILVTCIGNVGKMAIAMTPLTTNQQINALVLHNNDHIKYVFYAVKSSMMRYVGKANQALVPIINATTFGKVKIPLPPTHEDQKAIANDLERKMAEVEKMRQAALRQKEAATAMQGAILREAFPWKEREKLPEGWRWGKLGKLAARIQYGISISSTKDNVGPRLLRITDIQNGNVDWNAVPHCRCNNNEEKEYLLEDGDIVFTRTGATTGKSFLIRNPTHALFASYLIRVQCDRNQINPEYLYSFFQSPNYWIILNKGARGGTLAGFNATMLSKLTIPLPPSLKEQITIANKLEQKLAEAIKLHQTSERQLEAAEAMPGAVLREVFDFEPERN